MGSSGVHSAAFDPEYEILGPWHVPCSFLIGLKNGNPREHTHYLKAH